MKNWKSAQKDGQEMLQILQEQMSELKTGDTFIAQPISVAPQEVFRVADGNFIDRDGNRQVLYQTLTDGLHAHAADHTPVWAVHNL